MTTIDEKIKEFNIFLNQFLWFDFSVQSFDGSELIISAGTDLTRRPEILVRFSDVSFLLTKIDWTKKDNSNAIKVWDDEHSIAFNKLYRIEVGNYLFAISHQDENELYNSRYVIAAKNFNFNKL